MATIKMEKTERGFLRGEFTDRYGHECSIQESSLATEECIWLGCDHETEEEERLRAWHNDRVL